MAVKPNQPHSRPSTMKPVQIDVYYPIPEGWGMCNPCELMMSQAGLGQAPEERGLEEYPQELKEEFARLSTTLYALAERFQGQVEIKVWDPRSLQGMWKCIRHGVRHYPTFIIGGRDKLTEPDMAKLEQVVHSALESGVSAI
ncbi:MAG TPA: hypothetical protein VLD65_07730 [Anaerolineales bacterium]|nr:hypothetical protein [Anaerolineales bacterium]